MKRILLYSCQSLFEQSIKTLLDAQPELNVIGWENDINAVLERAQSERPDAVVVIQTTASTTRITEALQLLQVDGVTRIVELHLEHSRGHIYDGRDLTIRDVGDLVNALVEPEEKQPGLRDE